MKKYRATQFMTLRSGLVGLTDAQLRRRFNEVRPTDETGIYEITGECRFKAGEEFSWDGEPIKRDAALFDEVDEVEVAASEGSDTGEESGADKKGRKKS